LLCRLEIRVCEIQQSKEGEVTRPVKCKCEWHDAPHMSGARAACQRPTQARLPAGCGQASAIPHVWAPLTRDGQA
jgi:hypothetical protein